MTALPNGTRVGSDIGPGALYPAVALSLVAASLHAWVMPEHFVEWWGYGLFFLAVAAAQGLGGVALLRRPSKTLLSAGIGGNLLIVVLWATTRTAGIPFFGPHAWEVEGVGAVDLACTLAEIALIVVLIGPLLSRPVRAPGNKEEAR